ncbi:DUF2970 domain-containing protein [Pusillimonas sp. ANT_WB101]|uniref:DUF2970 domain-containing protein n=1 Tax=Pusillimonas sp. ANT_WB101 TaxID=2597356 RepID=UPI0011ECC791|nr:DUF2970 domain-containing protein [Pusillimonas sp. ANT_WB101]KAA0890774.1 DUF2970 domain-containing protein [Pusillimonas sp. ANT_WB101]
MSKDIKKLAERRLNFFQTMKAVAWGFFGVRKNRGYDEDIARINPVHLIIAGILSAIVFVVGLVMIARWLTGSLA